MRPTFPARHAFFGALISVSLVAGAAAARPVERVQPKPATDQRGAAADNDPKRFAL